MPSPIWLWRLQAIRVGPSAAPRLALDSLEIRSGCTVVVGPSGSGKSTLLGLLTGFVRAEAGTVERAAHDARLPVFWACGGAALWPGLPARRQLALAAPPGGDPSPLLNAFDLAHRRDAPPERMSAGERDRLEVARAVASAASVLVLDEPFAHCGREQARALWASVRAQAAGNGQSLVVATHDEALAATADRVVRLDSGQLVQAAAALLLVLLLTACGGSASTIPAQAFALPLDGSTLPSPRALGRLADGGMIVLDTAGRVLDYGADLTLRASWRMPAWTDGRPEGVCELPDGRLAVADTHYHRVVIFARGGAVLATWGKEGDGPGEFRWPVSICCDPQGRIYVGEYGGNDRVQRFAADGTPQLSFGAFGSGPGKLQRPQGLGWRDGLIYVADTLNARIAVWTQDGAWRGEQAVGALNMPYGCAVDATGLVLADYGAQRLVRLDAAGAVVVTWGVPGRGEAGLSTPWAATTDVGGRGWIADTGNRRVWVVGW